MKDLVEYIVTSLVDHPDQVRLKTIEGVHTVVFELRVAPDDMGKVIGKEGRIANATRTLLRVAASTEGKRAMLEIV